MSQQDKPKDSELDVWRRQLEETPYRSYLYAYPHKTAYRPLQPPLPLKQLWSQEMGDTFFLYMHIPFCEARCGFCNLFTLPDRKEQTHQLYVDALERQAMQWASFVKRRPFSRFALGGGTPTLLTAPMLERLFHIAEHIMGLNPEQAFISVETSPATATSDRLEVLRRRGVDRISMGVQSFIEAETAAIFRPQRLEQMTAAIERIQQAQFPIMNLDLIYGLPGQTVESWLYSLNTALSYEPEELFLYPLYARENTRLGSSAGQTDIRLACYHAAVRRLKEQGYVQTSMRCFVRAGLSLAKRPLDYNCQEEGMVGLGCGARSYTRDVHYASRYAVTNQTARSIIADYVHTKDYTTANYGYVLPEAEQKRRFVIKGLLQRPGLSLSAYAHRFGAEALAEFPELKRLIQVNLAQLAGDLLALTDEGLAYSDAIGDELISNVVREQMKGYIPL